MKLQSTGVFSCDTCGRVMLKRVVSLNKVKMIDVIWKCGGCSKLEPECDCKRLPEIVKFGDIIPRMKTG
jgi:predicted metal-binding protein